MSPPPSGPPLPAEEDEGEVRAAPLPAAAGAPPPLPDAGAVAAAAGRPLELDRTAPPHPMAAAGRSATYTAADGTTLQLTWLDPGLLPALRATPGILRRQSGVGDEAYRAAIGGGIVARRGGQVLVVTGRLPGSSDGDRARVLEDVARVALGAAGRGSPTSPVG